MRLFINPSKISWLNLPFRVSRLDTTPFFVSGVSVFGLADGGLGVGMGGVWGESWVIMLSIEVLIVGARVIRVFERVKEDEGGKEKFWGLRWGEWGGGGGLLKGGWGFFEVGWWGSLEDIQSSTWDTIARSFLIFSESSVVLNLCFFMFLKIRSRLI